MDGIFAWIVEEVAQAGYLSPQAVFIDGTHIKANATSEGADFGGVQMLCPATDGRSECRPESAWEEAL